MAKAWLISDEAQQDIDDIIENIVEYTSWTSTGIKLYSELYEKFELIASLPKCGRQRFDDTREIFTRSYRIVYKEFEDHIKIIAVIHARRLYPKR
jgi:toxin ParE1/3/4